MYKNTAGKYEAFLSGPTVQPGRMETGFTKIYDNYVKLYNDFESLASTFRRELIPKNHLILVNGTLEERTYIPYYRQQLLLADNDEVRAKLLQLQEYTIQRWEQLEELMESLCNDPYVHAVSLFSKAKMTYDYGGYTTFKNVTDTNGYNIPPWDIKNMSIERDPRTIEEYRKALMTVVSQEK